MTSRRISDMYAPPKAEPAPQRHGVRRFDGARIDRLTASWRADARAIDSELKSDLDKLRARSRSLFKNSPHMARFGRLAKTNIVGAEGFRLQSLASDPDGTRDFMANQAIEWAWWHWGRAKYCDVTGRHSFVAICQAAALSLVRDGEFLIRIVRGRGKYGLQLQSLNVDRIDTSHNRAAMRGKNAVVMGVELNRWLQPVAYHLWTAPDAATGQRKRERVMAKDLIHGFIPLEDEQTRGVPFGHAVMRVLNDLKGYTEASVIAARVGAAKMGVWETPDGSPPPGMALAGADGEVVEDEGSYITEAEPGHFDFAPPGYKLHTFDPTYPHDQFDAFTSAALRGVAAGTGVSYASLTNDRSKENFSSIRTGSLEDRDEWMVLQTALIDMLLTPIFEEWVALALLNGAIAMPSGKPLPASKLDKFQAHLFHGRRWSWVDPKKDIEAASLAMDRRISSPQKVASQMGVDVEDVLDDWVAFEQMAAAKGISITSPPAVNPPEIDKDELADDADA